MATRRQSPDITTEGSGDMGSWFDEPLGATESFLMDVTKPLREDDPADIMQSFTQGELQLTHLLALLSAALGVTGRGEIFMAAVAHMVWWFLGLKGVEGMYSALAGALIAKKRYAYAALPSLVDVYTAVQKARKSESGWLSSIKGDTAGKIILFTAGFVLAKLKYV